MRRNQKENERMKRAIKAAKKGEYVGYDYTTGEYFRIDAKNWEEKEGE